MRWVRRSGWLLIVLATLFVSLAWQSVWSEHQREVDRLWLEGRSNDKMPIFSSRKYVDPETLPDNALIYYALALASAVPGVLCLLAAWKWSSKKQQGEHADRADEGDWCSRIWRRLTIETTPPEIQRTQYLVLGILGAPLAALAWFGGNWSLALAFTILPVVAFYRSWRYHRLAQSRMTETEGAPKLDAEEAGRADNS